MVGEDFCRFGILTASDRASSGDYEDLSGPAIEDFLHEAVSSSWEVIRIIVPDEQSEIEEALCDLSDNQKCSIILTTGGTGPAPRDVSPEATNAVCQKMLPGFGEQMRNISFEICPYCYIIKTNGGNKRQYSDN